MDYQPRVGSLAARVCAWFKANPGRKLSANEICARFGATNTSNAAAQLGAAEDADLLASERVGVMNVYSAGPRLAKWKPDATDLALTEQSAAPAPAAAPASAPPEPKRVIKRTYLPPASAIRIEDGVPMPSLRTPANGSPFDAIFAAMKPGQSFARPHDEAKALKASADRWAKRHTAGKAKFAMRQVNETESRVWRKE